MQFSCIFEKKSHGLMSEVGGEIYIMENWAFSYPNIGTKLWCYIFFFVYCVSFYWLSLKLYKKECSPPFASWWIVIIMMYNTPRKILYEIICNGQLYYARKICDIWWSKNWIITYETAIRFCSAISFILPHLLLL
jgi:hypothetical protein